MKYYYIKVVFFVNSMYSNKINYLPISIFNTFFHHFGALEKFLLWLYCKYISFKLSIFFKVVHWLSFPIKYMHVIRLFFFCI